MNGRGIKKRPTFVPIEYRPAFDAVSKAHLEDLVWSLCGRLAERGCDELASVFEAACSESDRVALEREDLGLRVALERFQRRHDRAERGMVGPVYEDEDGGGS